MAVLQRVVLEGNIGAGKTSLGLLLETMEPGMVQFYPEPVEQWRLEDGAHVLEVFYEKLPWGQVSGPDPHQSNQRG